MPAGSVNKFLLKKYLYHMVSVVIPECLDVTPKGGSFILKPDNPHLIQVSANEVAPMHIAGFAGLETRCQESYTRKIISFCILISFFEWLRIDSERLMILFSLPLAKKHDATNINPIRVVNEYASFPALELSRLNRLLLLNFLVAMNMASLRIFLITDAKGVALI